MKKHLLKHKVVTFVPFEFNIGNVQFHLEFPWA